MHLIKYILFVLFLFALLILFESNRQTSISLHFDALIRHWESRPIPLNYLLLISFSVGFLLAAVAGALRMAAVRARKRELKELGRQAQGHPPSPIYRRSDSLPPLAE